MNIVKVLCAASLFLPSTAWAGNVSRPLPALIPRTVISGWADRVGLYFSGKTPDLSGLNTVVPQVLQLERFGREDALAPVASQLQQAAENLLRDNDQGRGDWTTVAERSALLNHPGLRYFLDDTTRARINRLAQTSRGYVDDGAWGAIRAKMLTVTSALIEDWPRRVTFAALPDEHLTPLVVALQRPANVALVRSVSTTSPFDLHVTGARPSKDGRTTYDIRLRDSGASVKLLTVVDADRTLQIVRTSPIQ